MEVKLVGMVTNIKKNNGNQSLIAIIVGPMSRTSRHSKEVPCTYMADLLMSVSELPGRLLRLLVCFGATGKYNSLEPSPYSTKKSSHYHFHSQQQKG